MSNLVTLPLIHSLQLLPEDDGHPNNNNKDKVVVVRSKEFAFADVGVRVQEDVPDHDDPHRGGLGNLLRRRAGSGDTVHMYFGVGKNGEVRLPIEIRRLELQKQNCLTYSCLTDSKLHVNGVYR